MSKLTIEESLDKISRWGFAIILIVAALILAINLRHFQQMKEQEKEIKNSLASSLESSVRTKDLIQIQQIIGGFAAADPYMQMGLQFEDGTLIGTSQCDLTTKDKFEVGLTGEPYYVCLHKPVDMIFIATTTTCTIVFLVLNGFFALHANKIFRELNSDLNLIVSREKREPIFVEIGEIISRLESALISERIAHEKVVRIEATESHAKQVAHDIRSPLSALNVVAENIEGVSEDCQILLKESVNRINHIANNLLRPAHKRKNHEITMVNGIVDLIVREKKLEFHDSDRIEIRSEYDRALKYPSVLDANELGTCLSNAITNSVESLSRGGVVTVSVTIENRFIRIDVIDNGDGIPPDLIDKIGTKGFSYGKSDMSYSGHGLGVYHAKTFLESVGGRYEIKSDQGTGTTVSMWVPETQIGQG